MLYDIIIPEPSMFSYVIHGYVNMTCDIIPTPNPKSENKKINENEVDYLHLAIL